VFFGGRFLFSTHVYNAPMRGQWETVDVHGKSLDFYVPAGAAPQFAVLFLHDLGQIIPRADDAWTTQAENLRLALGCPQGGQYWWVDRRCPEFDERLTPERFLIENVVPAFRQRWPVASGALGVVGIGMGGQGAVRLAFKHPKVFPVVAGVNPLLDFYEAYGSGTPLDEMYESREQCRQDTALLHIHPSHFPPHVYFGCEAESAAYQGCDRLHEKLVALGVSHEFDSALPSTDAAIERALKFVRSGLEQESRRLL
jgi:S-formylglutathione hydrolase